MKEGSTRWQPTMLSIESPQVPRGQNWKRKQPADNTGWHPGSQQNHPKFQRDKVNRFACWQQGLTSHIWANSKKVPKSQKIDLPAADTGWHQQRLKRFFQQRSCEIQHWLWQKIKIEKSTKTIIWTADSHKVPKLKRDSKDPVRCTAFWQKLKSQTLRSMLGCHRLMAPWKSSKLDCLSRLSEMTLNCHVFGMHSLRCHIMLYAQHTKEWIKFWKSWYAVATGQLYQLWILVGPTLAVPEIGWNLLRQNSENTFMKFGNGQQRILQRFMTYL